MLDDIDRKIIRRYQADPDQSPADLATDLGVGGAALGRRLDRMRDTGHLLGRRALIDWGKLGFAVEVSLRFTLDKTRADAFDSFLAAAREVPEVIEIQTFLGRVDVRLNVLARDMAHYQEIYRARILALPHIAEVEALMLVSTLRDERALPL